MYLERTAETRSVAVVDALSSVVTGTSWVGAAGAKLRALYLCPRPSHGALAGDLIAILLQDLVPIWSVFPSLKPSPLAGLTALWKQP